MFMTFGRKTTRIVAAMFSNIYIGAAACDITHGKRMRKGAHTQERARMFSHAR